jgi:hypothetical protein
MLAYLYLIKDPLPYLLSRSTVQLRVLLEVYYIQQLQALKAPLNYGTQGNGEGDCENRGGGG